MSKPLLGALLFTSVYRPRYTVALLISTVWFEVLLLMILKLLFSAPSMRTVAPLSALTAQFVA